MEEIWLQTRFTHIASEKLFQTSGHPPLCWPHVPADVFKENESDEEGEKFYLGLWTAPPPYLFCRPRS